MSDVPNLDIYGINVKDELGGGTYGTVYSAEYQDEMVAVKYMKGLDVGDLNEMDVQSRISNDYLSSTLGVLLPYSSEIGGTVIIMPLAIKTSRIIISGEYTFCERVSYLRKVIEAVNCLHSVGVLHLDIKIANILNHRVTLTHRGKCYNLYEPVVSDFGLCRVVKSIIDGKYMPTELLTSTGLGTPSWSAPEHIKYYYLPEGSDKTLTREDIIKMRTYRGASDIWSLALFAYRILTGFRVYPSYVEKDGYKTEDIYSTYVEFFGTPSAREKLLREDIERSKRIPEDKRNLVYDLLYPMFSWNPTDRPTTGELLKSPIFSEIVTPLSNCYETESTWPPIDLRDIDPNDLDKHYAAVRAIVKSIVIWLTKSNMKGLDIGVMYHAVDIIYRYALKVGTFVLTESRDLLGVTCIYIALNYGGFKPRHVKLYQKLPRNVPVYTIEEIYEQQEKILSVLRLVVYRRFLYDSIREKSDVISHYLNIIFNPKEYYQTIPSPVNPETFSNPSVSNLTIADVGFQ